MLLGFLFATLALSPIQQSTDSPSPKLDRWEIVGGDEEGEFSIDPQTMKRQGNRVHVFVRLQLRTDSVDNPEAGVISYVYDCKANTALVERVDIFDENGELLNSDPTATSDQVNEPIKANTPNAAVLKRIC